MKSIVIGRAYPSGGFVSDARQPQAPDLPGEHRITLCAQDAEPAKSGSPTSQPSPGHELADFLIPLIAALHEQTAALNRLASSNEALVNAMAQDDGDDPDTEPRTYMDGSPVRQP